MLWWPPSQILDPVAELRGLMVWSPSFPHFVPSMPSISWPSLLRSSPINSSYRLWRSAVGFHVGPSGDQLLNTFLCILSQRFNSGCNNLPNTVQYNIFKKNPLLYFVFTALRYPVFSTLWWYFWWAKLGLYALVPLCLDLPLLWICMLHWHNQIVHSNCTRCCRNCQLSGWVLIFTGRSRLCCIL